MPVPYPPPEKLPVIMCSVNDCCYRRHTTRMDKPICQQHERMYGRSGRVDQPLNFGSVELKYTRDGYPHPN